MQVDHADTLLQWSRRLLGSTLTNAVIQRTFFAHFCGGAPQDACNHLESAPAVSPGKITRQGSAALGCSLVHCGRHMLHLCACVRWVVMRKSS